MNCTVTSLLDILRLSFCCLECFSITLHRRHSNHWNWYSFRSELKDALSNITLPHSAILKTLFFTRITEVPINFYLPGQCEVGLVPNNWLRKNNFMHCSLDFLSSHSTRNILFYGCSFPFFRASRLTRLQECSDLHSHPSRREYIGALCQSGG